MLLGSWAPTFLWAEIVKTALYLLNHSPTNENGGGLPKEKFIGVMPSLRHLQAFGCMVFIHIPKWYRDKLESRLEQGVFIGYDDSTKGYMVYLPHKRKVTVSWDLTFNETLIYR